MYENIENYYLFVCFGKDYIEFDDWHTKYDENLIYS